MQRFSSWSLLHELLACSGIAAVLSIGLCCTGAKADAAACKSLADAMLANTRTPYHSVGTMTFDAAGTSGAPDATKSLPLETIFTGTDVFVRLPSGKWQNVHASLDKLIERVRENADSFTDCQRLADETVDGKDVAVYVGNSKNDQRLITTKVWVAPDRGVLVRTETDMRGTPQPDGAVRHQHLALRYDYKDIKAPADLSDAQ